MLTEKHSSNLYWFLTAARPFDAPKLSHPVRATKRDRCAGRSAFIAASAKPIRALVHV